MTKGKTNFLTPIKGARYQKNYRGGSFTIASCDTISVLDIEPENREAWRKAAWAEEVYRGAIEDWEFANPYVDITND
jgi:hypothetical protein|tara:strand:- start:78 stop:308 length:231 start_codon:yes stop_codon:yes gene_type:complete